MNACFSYLAPGLVPVIQQPSSLVCWATAYAIMRSWNESRSYDIRGAAAAVAEKYGVMVDRNQALPASEFKAFLVAADMQREPMWSLPVEGWLGLLQDNGLLWVGTLGVVNPGTYLHSRIVEGMYGDGSTTATWMKIVDPENGTRYTETFGRFLDRYEGARRLSTANEYYQIRHF